MKLVCLLFLMIGVLMCECGIIVCAVASASHQGWAVVLGRLLKIHV